MAQVIITIPDAVLPRVLDAVAARYSYNAQNGQTKAQFAKSQVIAMLKDAVLWYEGTQAAQTAQQTAVTQVNAEVTLT